MTTPNDSDAERELQRVEEIERNKMQDRTRAIVEAAEALESALHERAEQHVVGRNAELRDVEYMIEHGGGLDGSIARECVRQLVRAVAIPSPQWTRTPPSEPGLYFLRVPDPRGKHRIKIGAINPQQGHGEVSFIGGDLGVPLAELNEHEWWPVPIQPPEET